MKKINTLYWVFTGMVIASQGVGSVVGLILPAHAGEQITSLGYPVYLAPFLDVARILGIVAILKRGNPRLKEWAYAGLMFDVIGALYSHIASGKPLIHMIFPLIAIIVLSGSYILYHRKLDMAKVISAS
ncbi:MAG TPA: DoxX family protein [Cyclobacteriaceae bacterium]